MTSSDKKIINILNSKPQDFWDFKDDYHKTHIHGIATYPATMVPNMQEELIDIICNNQYLEINSLLDPFMGSGTTLVLGMLKGLDIYGIDINPLAYLICLVKTTPVSPNKLRQKKDYLFKLLESNFNYEITSFPGIEKWFKPSVINQVSKIKSCILKEKDIIFRRIFWISFAETIRKSWNSRSSTHKLYIKDSVNIEQHNIDCINFFKKHLISLIDRMEDFTNLITDYVTPKPKIIHYSKTRRLYCNDSAVILSDQRRFKHNSIDLIVTSPPYGDNHTTVSYGQNSVLQLRWMELNDISPNIPSSLIDTLTGIDKKSAGGLFYSNDFIRDSNILLKSNTLLSVYNRLLSDNKEEKARKVASFMLDLEKIVKYSFNILKPNHYAVFTTGNRVVNGEIIELDKILIELCASMNFELIYDFKRNILHKTSPSQVSTNKENKKIKSIDEETVTIFKKPAV